MCHRRPSERTTREPEREESTADPEERPHEAPVAADGSGGPVARVRAALARVGARLS